MILKGCDYTTFLSKKQIQRVLKISRRSGGFSCRACLLYAKILKFSLLASKILFHCGVQNTAREDAPRQYALRVKPQINIADRADEILNSKILSARLFKFQNLSSA